jgi:hypothetical protein
MDVLTSSEFRKCYATLAKSTRVTVNGHVIGQWTPIGTTSEVMSYPDGQGGYETRVERDPSRYASFTKFRPVPKPSKRK